MYVIVRLELPSMSRHASRQNGAHARHKGCQITATMKDHKKRHHQEPPQPAKEAAEALDDAAVDVPPAPEPASAGAVLESSDEVAMLKDRHLRLAAEFDNF